MKPQFKATTEGFVIIDPVERLRYQITTETSVKPTPTDNSQIPYPMDSAVTIRTNGLTLPEESSIYIRYPDGTLYADIHPDNDVSLPPDTYILDLSGPLKIYVYIDDRIDINFDGIDSKTNICLGSITELVISARSVHGRPTETIETTAKPTDVMEAVSTFGSALKTTTTERSYPTLRGHPPIIKLADELSIPNEIERPQTGIHIETPPTLRHVFVVAPLAYYLAAKVIPGSKPQIVTETGWTYSLEGEDGFEATVEKILKQVFLLDCVVQTEGETPDPLYERQELEPLLEFNFRDLYNASIAERLETYLEASFATVESQLPKWYSETHMKPTENHIEFLPFIARDITSVKVANRKDCTGSTLPESLRYSSYTYDETASAQIKDLNYSENGDRKLSVPTIQQFWQSKNSNEVTSTKPLSAFQNSITQTPRDGPLSIEVICNDSSMSDEVVTVNSIYGSQYDLPFDFTIHHDLTSAELGDVLSKKSDFVHYIGHIDTDGFRCSDGILDASTIETVGTKAFFLNACESYRQGLSLIEAGSIGGIVTQTEIKNSVAAAVGSTIARLLDDGYPLYAALNIVLRSRSGEHNYHIIGDEKLVVSDEVADTPILCELIQSKNKNYDIKLTSYLSPKYGHGSIYTPYIPSVNNYHIVPGERTFQSLSKAHLVEFFNKEPFPVHFNDELRWSTEIKTSEL